MEVPMDKEKDSATRTGGSVPTHEQIRRDDDADATRRATRRARTCRECGGYGRFWWGVQDHGECGACRGTGRV